MKAINKISLITLIFPVLVSGNPPNTLDKDLSADSMAYIANSLEYSIRQINSKQCDQAKKTINDLLKSFRSRGEMGQSKFRYQGMCQIDDDTGFDYKVRSEWNVIQIGIIQANDLEKLVKDCLEIAELKFEKKNVTAGIRNAKPVSESSVPKHYVKGDCFFDISHYKYSYRVKIAAMAMENVVSIYQKCKSLKDTIFSKSDKEHIDEIDIKVDILNNGVD